MLYGGRIYGVFPGQSCTLFDGTETPGAAVKSGAIVRGNSPLGNPGITFTIDFPSAPTAVVLIQAANQDAEADYQTIWTSTNAQHDNITDTGRWRFYRAQLSTYSAGGMPIVMANR